MATPPKPKDNTPAPDQWVRFTDEKGSGWARKGPGGKTTYEKRYDPPSKPSANNPLETDTPALDSITDHKNHGIRRYTTKGGTVLEAEVRELPNGQYQLYDRKYNRPLATFNTKAEMDRYVEVRQDDTTGWTDTSLSNQNRSQTPPAGGPNRPADRRWYPHDAGDVQEDGRDKNGNGIITYTDGSKTVWRNGKIVQRLWPDGSQVNDTPPVTGGGDTTGGNTGGDDTGGNTGNNTTDTNRPGDVIQPNNGAEAIRDDHMRPGGQPAGEGIGVEKSLDDVKSHGYMGETSAEKTYSYTDAKGNDNTLTFRPNGVVVQTKADGTSYTIYNPANNGGKPWPGFNNLGIENPNAGQPTPGNPGMAANNDNQGPTDSGRDDRPPLTGGGDTAPTAGTPTTGNPTTGTPATETTPTTGSPTSGAPTTGTPATETPMTGSPDGAPTTGSTPTTSTPTTGTSATETPLTGSGGSADQIANEINPTDNPITNPITGNSGSAPTTGGNNTGADSPPLTGSGGPAATDASSTGGYGDGLGAPASTPTTGPTDAGRADRPPITGAPPSTSTGIPITVVEESHFGHAAETAQPTPPTNPTPTPPVPGTGATDPLQENNPPPPEANPLGGLSADPGENQNRGYHYF